MKLPEKTQENIEKLARACVDSWDMNDTVEFAINQVEENLANSEGEEAAHTAVPHAHKAS